jgi:hypothetical protein
VVTGDGRQARITLEACQAEQAAAPGGGP